MSIASVFSETELFVLDMDGTVYLGEQLLPGAASLISFLKEKQIPFLFFTNNSSKSASDYIDKLGRLGIEIDRDDIMSSADVMVDYLQTHQAGEPICLLGTPACVETFETAGIEVNDAATICVAAFDTTLTYEKLVTFCDRLRDGALYLATHPDLNCPVEGGFIPDLGSMLALIEASTERLPSVIVGKPYKPTIEAIQGRTCVLPDHMVFVGDRLYTDMAVAKNHGAKAVLVLSGETDDAMLARSTISPDAVFTDLLAMLKAVRDHL